MVYKSVHRVRKEGHDRALERGKQTHQFYAPPARPAGRVQDLAANAKRQTVSCLDRKYDSFVCYFVCPDRLTHQPNWSYLSFIACRSLESASHRFRSFRVETNAKRTRERLQVCSQLRRFDRSSIERRELMWKVGGTANKTGDKCDYSRFNF